MTGTTRRNRIRKEAIRKKEGVKTEIAYRFRESLLKWLGHMERIDANCLAKKIDDSVNYK